MKATIRRSWVGLAAGMAVALLAGCGSLAGGGYLVGDVFAPSEVDAKPVLVTRVAPTYPAGELRSKIGAVVTVSFVVDEEGRVMAALVEPDQDEPAADPAFESAALAAVEQWRFKPGLKRGEPVKVAWRVPIEFRPAAL